MSLLGHAVSDLDPCLTVHELSRSSCQDGWRSVGTERYSSLPASLNPPSVLFCFEMGSCCVAQVSL